MRTVIIGSLACLAILGFACWSKSGTSRSSGKAANDEWQLITSTEGGFKVQMPGTPKRATKSLIKNGFAANEHSLVIEIGPTIAYAVRYFDLPEKPTSSQVESILEAVGDGFKGKGKVLSERSADLGGHRGQEFELEWLNGQAHIQVRTIVVESRVFSLIVVMPNQFFASPKNPETPKRARAFMSHFFDSFQITSN